jgi:E3 ubiquitin-protein ligase SHPRH
MPRPKGKGKVVAKTRQAPLSREENMSALVSLMTSLSLPQAEATTLLSDGVEDDSGERPAKRAKISSVGPEAISVMREDIVLPAYYISRQLQSPVLVRQDVGKIIMFKLKENRRPDGRLVAWDLYILSSESSAQFEIKYSIRGSELSDRALAALRIAESRSVPTDDAGILWAKVDLQLQGVKDSVVLRLTIEVRWNESRTVFGNFRRNSEQVALRNALFGCLWPALDLRRKENLELSWSPQDFYESTCVPEKNSEVSSEIIPEVTTRLYPFQRRALQWLLRREGVRWVDEEEGSGSISPLPPDVFDDTPVSFTRITGIDGKPFYMSPLFGLATKDVSPFIKLQQMRGGILAEEMGLGKTLEIIALVCLHKRLHGGPPTIYHYGQQLRPISTSLIITPATLLNQWLSEFDKHAPHLRVMHYNGMRKQLRDKHSEAELVDRLANHDVVITTYEVLRGEIHLAIDPPPRSLRLEKKYERPKSPLVQLHWWRVCIDEAQMVENWTTNAAVVSRLIPRQNAWAITGTPVKDDIQKDLRGLLNFLLLEPYASDTQIWNLLTTKDKGSFRDLFNLISMRHTKSAVRNEISIPPQKRYVITMPFTAVEEQHYQSLFKQLVEACGLDVYGNPIRDDWDPEDSAVQDAMRTALDRLRQTALHPEIGHQNRRALGHKAGPMRTVAEVLNAMIENSSGNLRTDQRNLLMTKLTRGQILAGMNRVEQARDLWEEVLQASNELVAECRDHLKRESQNARNGEGGARDADDREDALPAKRRLRSALEIQHKAVFFCAMAYYSIKSNEDMTVPESEAFERLQKMETDSYDLAKLIRTEVLQESSSKVKKMMDKIKDLATSQQFAVIPEFQFMDKKGIESRTIIDATEEIAGVLNDQADQLDEWREHVIQLLLKPLVDEDVDENEITGEEYEDSTKLQDEILVLIQFLRTAIADRHAALSGQRNELVEHELKTAERLALDGEGPFPEKFLDNLKVREAIKPHYSEGDSLCSVRGIISELRGLHVKLRHESATGSGRARTELAIVESQMKFVQAQLAAQLKVTTAMEQELEQFTGTLNARLEFYRQLQGLSDMVAEYDGEANGETLAIVFGQEESLRAKLATAQAKQRYLVHLKQAESSDEQRMCIICQSPFSIGVLTICGHQFCKECITLWTRAHHNCPVCKQVLRQNQLHDITFKPQELKVQSESGLHPAHSDRVDSPSRKKSTIYSEFDPEKLAAIKDIDLPGPNFTTKVDTLIRHILFLRESDPGAKSIIFSQYKEFLDVVATAFRRHHIGYTSFDKAHGIAQFKDDPSTEVFLLHARAHSSGLNLVNASHVFLCEPILNTALELQAIARVDRIGQQQETTVWLYIVDGTVEQSIYDLSVQRRMEHMGRNLKGKSKESTPELLDSNLDAANSLEMQQAQLSKLMGKGGISGEAVDKKDLWTCLFGQANKRTADDEHVRSNPAVRGLLAAEAAEQRRRDEAAD